MQILGLNIAPLALSVSLFATSFAPAEAFTGPRHTQIAQLGQDVEVVQYRRDGDWRRRDGDDWRRRDGFYRRGIRLTTTATVDITNVAAVIVDITAHGFRWVHWPPAPSLGASLQIGRFDTEAVMSSGVPIVTAATGLTTTLISLTTGRGACATLHIEQHQSAKDEERPVNEFQPGNA
jgi:hypothetical protein